MARYDVFANPSGNGYLLDVQADLLNDLNTRVVIPLLPSPANVKGVRKLNPTFKVHGKSHVMFTHLLASVPIAILTDPEASFMSHHDEIVGALDMVLQGF